MTHPMFKVIMAQTKPPVVTNVPVEVKSYDRPMTCCGMMMGSNLTDNVWTGDYYEDRWNKGYFHPTVGPATVDDVVARLRKLKLEASNLERNCLMISVSSEQPTAHEAAKREGFRTVFEFYNPNSGNIVSIMVYTQYADREEYLASIEANEEY
jgi:hypothetical protein